MYNIVPTEPAPATPPAGFYVYTHSTSDGVVFYVSIGSGVDAWNPDPHFFWTVFVEKNRHNTFTVGIVDAGLRYSDARHLRDQLLLEHGDTLVNISNPSRDIHLNELEIYWKKKKQIWPLILSAKTIEKSDTATAVEMYKQCIQLAKEISELGIEGGAVGELMEYHIAKAGKAGVIQALDRLTLCLCKLNRRNEAAQLAHDYFQYFRADRGLSASARIVKRVQIALPSDAKG